MEAQAPRYTLGQTLQSVIADQTDYMEGVLQFIDWVKRYNRAGRMMARVNLANAPAESDAEKDAQALAHFLADIETWLTTQEQHYQMRYTGLALVSHACMNVDLSHPVDAIINPPSEPAPKQRPPTKPAKKAPATKAKTITK